MAGSIQMKDGRTATWESVDESARGKPRKADRRTEHETPVRCEETRAIDGQQCFKIKHQDKHRFTPATPTRWRYSPAGSLGPWDVRT